MENAVKWISRLGILVAVAGIVVGAWLQVAVGHAYVGFNARLRTQERLFAVQVGLAMITSGLLLAVVAQIMGMLHTLTTKGQDPAQDAN